MSLFWSAAGKLSVLYVASVKLYLLPADTRLSVLSEMNFLFVYMSSPCSAEQPQHRVSGPAQTKHAIPLSLLHSPAE